MNNIDNNEYYLNWNDHMTYVRRTLINLLAQNELVDVTLCCEGGKLFAHKMLLSVCSQFFFEAFKENPCPHPIVIIKGVTYKEMKDLLKFMYDGEVSVEPNDFESFLKSAKLLKVYGLTECNGTEGYNQTTVKVKSDAEISNTQQIESETENENTHVKKENNVFQEVVDTDEPIGETIDTINFTELQASLPTPQYESPKDLELDNAAPEILKEHQSPEALHFHRCFSITAPGIKQTSPTQIQRNVSGVKKTRRFRPSERLKCSMCTKIFTHVNSLRQHMKVHTEGAKCSVCGRVLCRRYQLKVHLKTQHGIDFISKKQSARS